MAMIDLTRLRLRGRMKEQTFYCTNCGCDRQAINWRSVYQDSVVWLDGYTPSILPAKNPICLTCGWMHYHKPVQSKALRAAVFAADNGECVYCGSLKQPSIDHLIPQRFGGGHEFENLVTACRPCNCRRQTGRVDMLPIYGRYR